MVSPLTRTKISESPSIVKGEQEEGATPAPKRNYQVTDLMYMGARNENALADP